MNILFKPHRKARFKRKGDSVSQSSRLPCLRNYDDPRLIKFVIRGVLYLAILAYLFKPNVLHFFGVGAQPRAKTFLKLGGAVVVGSLVWSIGRLLVGG